MDQFIKYASEFDPDFESKIKGAAPSEIHELEKLTRIPLPESYRAFLSRFGHGDGGLEIAFDGFTNISDIIEFYNDEIDAGEWEIPPNTIIFGVGGLYINEIGLECRENGQEPRVVFVADGKIRRLYAESLPKLLYRRIFEAYMPLLFNMSVELEGENKTPILKKAEDIALKSGFQKHWFSDAVAFCGETPDSALFVLQYPGNLPTITLLSQKRSELKKLSREFQSNLNLTVAED